MYFYYTHYISSTCFCNTYTGYCITVSVDNWLDEAEKGFLDFCASTRLKVVDVSCCFMATITQRTFFTVIMGAVVTYYVWKQSWVIRVENQPPGHNGFYTMRAWWMTHYNQGTASFCSGTPSIPQELANHFQTHLLNTCWLFTRLF